MFREDVYKRQAFNGGNGIPVVLDREFIVQYLQLCAYLPDSTAITHHPVSYTHLAQSQRVERFYTVLAGIILQKQVCQPAGIGTEGRKFDFH